MARSPLAYFIAGVIGFSTIWGDVRSLRGGLFLTSVGFVFAAAARPRILIMQMQVFPKSL